MRSIRATCAAFPNGACQLLGWAGVCCWLGTWWRGLNRRGGSTLCHFSLPENQRDTQTDREGNGEEAAGGRETPCKPDVSHRDTEFRVTSDPNNFSRKTIVSELLLPSFLWTIWSWKAQRKLPCGHFQSQANREDKLCCSNPEHLFWASLPVLQGMCLFQLWIHCFPRSKCCVWSVNWARKGSINGAIIQLLRTYQKMYFLKQASYSVNQSA